MTFPNAGTLDYIPDGAVFWAKVGQRDLPIEFKKATTADVQAGTDDEKYVTPLALSSFVSDRVGQPFSVFDHLTGSEAPDNSGTDKYIKLTAGEDGVGGFNEGLLTNETTMGSGPTVEITAEIAVGPMAGEIVNLVNSENRHIAPGENSGATHIDQMQQITGSIYATSAGTNEAFFQQSSGALTLSNLQPPAQTNTGVGDRYSNANFDSAASPDARTGDKTDVKRIEATYYMRIV